MRHGCACFKKRLLPTLQFMKPLLERSRAKIRSSEGKMEVKEMAIKEQAVGREL